MRPISQDFLFDHIINIFYETKETNKTIISLEAILIIAIISDSAYRITVIAQNINIIFVA
jgi:hypothetical protein